MGRGHGRKNHPHRPLSGRTPPHGTASQAAANRQRRSDPDDHAYVRLRSARKGLRNDGQKARRNHQTADHFLSGAATRIAFSAWFASATDLFPASTMDDMKPDSTFRPDAETPRLVDRSANLHVSPILSLIAEHAAAADATRSVAPEVIAALKSNDVMRMSASRELGGLESSVTAIGRELEAVAAACTSTGWCLWNHLCVFHFYCGLFGPGHVERLREITAIRQWVCLPAGAGTGVRGKLAGEEVELNGVATFGSGGRYADYVGVTF